jgi:ribosomal protein S18 acetylase RimI-like enzyme
MAEDFEREQYGIAAKGNPRIAPFIKRKNGRQKEMREYFRKCMHSSRATVIVARDNSGIAAYSLLQIKKNLPVFELGEYGYIEDLYVTERYRRAGISRTLKELAFRWFRKKGVKAAVISVNPGNANARSIYEKWGFIPKNIELARWI